MMNNYFNQEALTNEAINQQEQPVCQTTAAEGQTVEDVCQQADVVNNQVEASANEVSETICQQAEAMSQDADVAANEEVSEEADVEATEGEAEEELLPVELFLRDNYEFRANVLSNKTEVRTRKSQESGNNPWHHLDKKALNSIVMVARKAMPKARSLKQQLTEAIYSELTPRWDPIADYFRQLPEWDGLNRVNHLFSRIPGITNQQLYWASVWLRSTVAHWLQADQMHANECVLTLIGEQGCGKSTFLRRLLPEHLREYYLDHVNLSNKFDKEMSLTNNLIVNLDELDQVRPAQQAELKQMLSKVRVNGRMIYGSEQTDRARYASFAATTNNRHPLRDRTGSRRYLCIEVASGQVIDTTTAINYDQLYAQVMAELKAGERYWFDHAETIAIQQFNIRYQDALDLETMISTCFRLPADGEYTPDLSTDQMLAVIAKAYPAVRVTHAVRIQLGKALSRLGYRRKDAKTNHSYYAVPLAA